MKNIVKQLKLAALTALMLGGLVAAPPLAGGVAYAAKPTGTINVLDSCNDTGRVCAGTDKNSLSAILKNIINLLLMVIGIISVLMIIIGGFRYTTSGGDGGQTKSARDTIIYAVVGLVIAIMSFAIVNFVLGKL